MLGGGGDLRESLLPADGQVLHLPEKASHPPDNQPGTGTSAPHPFCAQTWVGFLCLGSTYSCIWKNKFSLSFSHTQRHRYAHAYSTVTDNLEPVSLATCLLALNRNQRTFSFLLLPPTHNLMDWVLCRLTRQKQGCGRRAEAQGEAGRGTQVLPACPLFTVAHGLPPGLQAFSPW